MSARRLLRIMAGRLPDPVTRRELKERRRLQRYSVALEANRRLVEEIRQREQGVPGTRDFIADFISWPRVRP